MSLVFPSSPSVGDIFPTPSVPGQPSWIWSGLAWTSRGLSGATVTTSALPPSNPNNGDMWFNPADGTTYLWFQTAWIEISGGNAGPQGPQGVQGIPGIESFPLQYASIKLAANVALPANAWTTVLSLDVGSVGTWMVTAHVTQNATAASNTQASLWVDITQQSLAASGSTTGAANYLSNISLTGIATNPTGPILLRCGANAATTALAIYATAPNSSLQPVTGMVAVRIA